MTPWRDPGHSCSVSPSESGRPGLRSHRFRQDVGVLSPAARPPAAAGQSGIPSRGHLPHQGAGQPGTLSHAVFPEWPLGVTAGGACFSDFCSRPTVSCCACRRESASECTSSTRRRWQPRNTDRSPTRNMVRTRVDWLGNDSLFEQ